MRFGSLEPEGLEGNSMGRGRGKAKKNQFAARKGAVVGS